MITFVYRKCFLIYSQLFRALRRSGGSQNQVGHLEKNSIRVACSTHLLVILPLEAMCLKKKKKVGRGEVSSTLREERLWKSVSVITRAPRFYPTFLSC